MIRKLLKSQPLLVLMAIPGLLLAQQHHEIQFHDESVNQELPVFAVDAQPDYNSQNVNYLPITHDIELGRFMTYPNNDLAGLNPALITNARNFIGDDRNAFMVRGNVRNAQTGLLEQRTVVFSADNNSDLPDALLDGELFPIGDVNGDGRDNYIFFQPGVGTLLSSDGTIEDHGVTYFPNVSTPLNLFQNSVIGKDFTGNGFNDVILSFGQAFYIMQGNSDLSVFADQNNTLVIPRPDCQMNRIRTGGVMEVNGEPKLFYACDMQGETALKMVAFDSNGFDVVTTEFLGSAVSPIFLIALDENEFGPSLVLSTPSFTHVYAVDAGSSSIETGTTLWEENFALTNQYFVDKDDNLVFVDIVDEDLRLYRLSATQSGTFDFIQTLTVGDEMLQAMVHTGTNANGEDVFLIGHRNMNTGDFARSHVTVGASSLDVQSFTFGEEYFPLNRFGIFSYGDITGNGFDDLVTRTTGLNGALVEIFEGDTFNTRMAGPIEKLFGNNPRLIRDYVFGNFSSTDHLDFVRIIHNNATGVGELEFYQGPFPYSNTPDQVVEYTSALSIGMPSFQFVHASDISGNGYHELVIPDYQTGQGLFVVHGGSGFDLSSISNYDFTIPRTATQNIPITHFFGLGDVTGNGSEDFIVSNFQGLKLAFFEGKALGDIDFDNPDALFVLPGSVDAGVSHNFFTFTQLAVGDFNGDGVANIVVTPFHSFNAAQASATDGGPRLMMYEVPSVLDGSTHEPILAEQIPSDGLSFSHSPHPYDNIAFGVETFANLGDVNNSGSDELALIGGGPFTNGYVYTWDGLLNGEPDSQILANYSTLPLGAPGNFINVRFQAPVGNFTSQSPTSLAVLQDFGGEYRDAAIYIYNINRQIVSTRDEFSDLPQQISLSQNYPNPFNPTTVISYELPVASQIRLEVFDMLGRRVAVLADGQVEAGQHQATFDASQLSSGVYLYRLTAGQTTLTNRMTLIK